MKKLSSVIALALVTLLPAAPLVAQTSFGTITGVLRDASGAVLPDAAVTVTNENTGLTRSVTTDASGNYLVPSLLSGVYSVSAELKGFKKAHSPGNKLDVNQSLRIDLTLEIGEVTQTVEVQAEAPLLQSESSTVGTVIENKQVVELPLNGRSFTELTYLIPGAVRQGGAIFQNSGSRVAISGARSEDNNYTLDGVNNNETFFKAFAVQPSVDAIQEFKVQTNITSAEFGQAAGANINVATKSGTNDIHGGIFEFLRNNALDARDPFAPTKPTFRQNQFGGQVGGPIFKNKTFFFFNYEGFRFSRSATALGTIPTPEMFAGNLAFDHTGAPALPIYDPATTREVNGQLVRDPFPNKIIPSDRIDPIIKSYIGLFYPAPNLPGQAANIINTSSGTRTADQYTIRIDHKISDSNNFFSRFSYVQSENNSPNALGASVNKTSNAFRNFMISDTHLFNPTTILDLKLAYHRNNLQIADVGPSDLATVEAWLQSTGIQGIPIKNANVPLYPQFRLEGGYTSPPQDGYPFPDDTYQILANLSKTKGKHFLKFGMDYQNRRNLDDGLFSANIHFDKSATLDPQNAAGTGQAVASYLLGLPYTALRNVGDTTALMRWSGYYFYAQDDIHVNSKLTINVGLRYDYTQWPRHRDNKLGSFDLDTGQYLWAGTNPITGEPSNTFPTVIYPDKNNWAPRLGMAYLLNNKTTIRAGYGVFYNTNFLWEAQGIRGNWPYAISETKTNLNQGIAATNVNVKTVFEPYTSTGPNTNVPPDSQHIADRHRRVSYMQQWNFHVQREVAGNIVLEAGYVGTKGSRASIFANANTAQPGPGPVQARRPHTNLGATSLMTDMASSIYNGAQFKAEKRFSQGLAFMGTYTFSRNINTGGDGFSLSSSPQDPACIECDRALSSFHHKNIFALNFVYELPFGKGKKFGTDINPVANHILGGWQFNGIITAGSGQPLNVGIGRDIANIGARAVGQRPNLNGNPNIDNPTVDRWFDPSVFSEPAPYTYGNAGRNIIIGPGYQYWTLGLYKNFYIKERHRIQFRTEFFNAFNNVNLSNPTTGFDSVNIGRIFGSDSARQIQFGLKYSF